MMNKLKLVLLTSTLITLFACTPKQTTPVKTGYLKNEISQAELQNATNYKKQVLSLIYRLTSRFQKKAVKKITLVSISN